MEDQQVENLKKQQEQEEAMKIRRKELEIRERMRNMFRDLQNKKIKEQSLDKRQKKEMKIKLAKDQAEATI